MYKSAELLQSQKMVGFSALINEWSSYMTKRQFLLRMNWRLVPIKRTRRHEIVNHYRAVIDQNMANGNSEESSVEALGNINSLCSMILKKEKKPVIMPVLGTIANVLWIIIAAVVMFAAMCLLLCIAGGIGYIGYVLVKNGLDTFMPSGYLISSNMMGAAFKIGTCMLIASIVIVLILFVKLFLTGAIKLFIYMIKKVRDSVYRAESTRLMKEAFKRETVN